MCFRQRRLVVLLSCSLLAGCSGGLSGKRFSTTAFTRVLQPGRHVSEEDRARSDFAAANSRVAEERGELQNAEDMYQEAIRINPENADALWRLALLHVRQEKFDEATQAFERARALDEKNPALCADFGYHLYLAGDLQRAGSSRPARSPGLAPSAPASGTAAGQEPCRRGVNGLGRPAKAAPPAPAAPAAVRGASGPSPTWHRDANHRNRPHPSAGPGPPGPTGSP